MQKPADIGRELLAAISAVAVNENFNGAQLDEADMKKAAMAAEA